MPCEIVSSGPRASRARRRSSCESRGGPTAGARIASALLVALAAALGGAPVASGAAADAVDAVRACRAERDDSRRLACFDAASARLGEAGTPVVGTGGTPPGTSSGGATRSGAAAAGSAAATAQMTPEQRFGYRGDIAREALDRQKAEQPQLDRLTSTVTSAAQQATGDFVVTLANGQVWAQLPTGTPQRLKAGDEVTITPASLGSFVLKGPSGRGVRVKRVR